MNVEERELKLKAKQKELDQLEADIRKREKALKKKEQEKKQILLRLSPNLWNDIAEWADADIRSINGQIEFLLTEAVRQRKKK
ncbi:MAG: hypothetical protein KBS68_05035 [Clostridiales bacterium]|nr:hypothetical protein [Candidatus Crickella merdequi]